MLYLFKGKRVRENRKCVWFIEVEGFFNFMIIWVWKLFKIIYGFKWVDFI